MASTFRDETQLVFISLLSRFVVILIQIVGRSILSDYDTSTERCLTQTSESYKVCNTLTFVLCANLKWDGEYFISIAEEGYQYEQTMAFFPLLPGLCRVLEESVSLPVRRLCNFNLRVSILFSAFLLNLCLFVLTVVALYHVVYIVCGTKRVAMISSILFCVSPASVFMSVMYSEILFSFCTFVGLWLLLTGRLWLSSLCFALSSAARSNGIVNCGFIAYSCISRLWNQRQCLKNTILHILVCAIQCFITLLPFLAFQVYGYFQFCTRGSDRPWCYDYIPLMYSFIQKQYWNVGLFRYYELKQLPNFFLASPVVVLSTIYVVVYFKSALERQFNPDFHIRKKCYNGGVWSVTALPFVVHLAFLLLVGTTSMHVQVITRLICSSTPGFYWFAGHVMDLDGKEFTHSQLCRCLVGLYFVTFSVVGTLMHSTFYPWT